MEELLGFLLIDDNDDKERVDIVSLRDGRPQRAARFGVDVRALEQIIIAESKVRQGRPTSDMRSCTFLSG